MEKICAVVDSQGFFIRNQFYPREVAIVCDSLQICQEFNPNIDWFDLNKQESKTINYVKKNIHGLSLNVFRGKSIVPKSEHMVPYLRSIYKLVATEDKPCFGVKNYILKIELEKADIPVIDLSEAQNKLPLLEIERKFENQWVCAYHRVTTQTPDLFRCALCKCFNIWLYLKELLEDIKIEPLQMCKKNGAN